MLSNWKTSAAGVALGVQHVATQGHSIGHILFALLISMVGILAKDA